MNDKYGHDENQLTSRPLSSGQFMILNIFALTKTKDMETSIQHAYRPSYSVPAAKTSLWKKFISWADSQEEHRFGWAAFAIMGHGSVFTIITVMIILFTGNHFIFWPFAIGAMAACLIVNLAALPTKITIPVLLFSVLIDVVIIGICLANGFDFAASYR